MEINKEKQENTNGKLIQTYDNKEVREVDGIKYVYRVGEVGEGFLWPHDFNFPIYGSGNDDYRQGYYNGWMAVNKKQLAQEWEKGFRNGINFVYEQFPFLHDSVEERIKNDDLEEFSTIDKDSGCNEFDETKWDNEIEKEIKKNQERIIGSKDIDQINFQSKEFRLGFQKGTSWIMDMVPENVIDNWEEEDKEIVDEIDKVLAEKIV